MSFRVVGERIKSEFRLVLMQQHKKTNFKQNLTNKNTQTNPQSSLSLTTQVESSKEEGSNQSINPTLLYYSTVVREVLYTYRTVSPTPSHSFNN